MNDPKRRVNAMIVMICRRVDISQMTIISAIRLLEFQASRISSSDVKIIHIKCGLFPSDEGNPPEGPQPSGRRRRPMWTLNNMST